jgi:4-amino-4-deoxychorismate lyase
VLIKERRRAGYAREVAVHAQGIGRRLAVLGHGLVPIDTPILRADDLGALRGDGIFETIHVRDGRPWQFDEHMVRMARSAVRLNLDLPDRSALDGLAADALAGWPPETEAALRMVCTRGAESGGPVTLYATVVPIAATSIRARHSGITVATASLGFTADARQRAPWLLGGAKTLSYAVNMASQRWAAEQGVDDVLWVSADGFLLEAPTSTLVWLDDQTLWTVPAETTGILAGTTARFLLDHAAEAGFKSGERMVTATELSSIGGAWLVSSIRGIAEIRAIDGVSLRPSSETARLRDLLGFA